MESDRGGDPEDDKKKVKKSVDDIKKHLPKVAASLTVFAVVVNTLGDIPGLGTLKVFATTLDTTAQLIDPEVDQQCDKFDKFMKKIDAALSKIKSEISNIKELVDALTDKVETLLHLSGVNRIHTMYKNVIDSPNLHAWASDFASNKSNFSEARGDFMKKNVRELLDSVGKRKCKEDMKEYIKCLELLFTSRSMYMMIQNTYYTYTRDNNIDRKQMVSHEAKLYAEDIEIIITTAEELFPFLRVYKTIPRHWPIKIGYIPIIPAEPEFLRREVKEYKTLGGGLFARVFDRFDKDLQRNVKTYSLTPLKENEPSLVKLVFPSGNQTILLELGGVRQDGPYHYRYTSGTIEYGNVEWRDEEPRDADGNGGRVDLLKKEAGSNKIMYQVKRGRAEQGWVVVEEHTFNPEDGTWKKTK